MNKARRNLDRGFTEASPRLHMRLALQCVASTLYTALSTTPLGLVYAKDVVRGLE